MTEYPGKEYGILVSDDNETYDLADTVADSNSYTYFIRKEFDEKYIKVACKTEQGKTVESFPLVVQKTGEGYDVFFIDSDEDGLDDISEKILGTDPGKADTDGDGLRDDQEVYVTGTDPLCYDSVVQGIADGEADQDEDGLSNIREIEVGMDTLASDTDGDGLSDGEEQDIHGTDPLQADTDGDGLRDGDEIPIALNPVNPETFGYPDREYISVQCILEEDDVLSKVNTRDNAYALSVKVEAAGYAGSAMAVSESTYSNVIDNDAQIGKAVDVSYDQTLQVDSCELSFRIDKKFIDNTSGKYAAYSDEFSDIKRLMVFRYDTKQHILVPVETKYDREGQIVMCNAVQPGAYCLLDMEIFLENLEFEIGEGTAGKIQE